MHTLIRRRSLWRLIWVCTVCKCPSPGLTDNPLNAALWRHSDKNSATINNRYLEFSSNARFDYIGQRKSRRQLPFLASVYYGSIVHNRSKNKHVMGSISRPKCSDHVQLRGCKGWCGSSLSAYTPKTPRHCSLNLTLNWHFCTATWEMTCTRAQRRLKTCPSAQSDKSRIVQRTLHPLLSKCVQWRFRSDCSNAQANLNLR